MFYGIFSQRSQETSETGNTRNPRFWQTLVGHGTTSHAGEVVNEVNAMEITAYSSALNAVANAFAQLPVHLYKTKAGKTSMDDASPLYRVVHDVVNDDGLTSFDFKKGLIINFYNKGRGAALIERNGKGEGIGVWPLNPSCLKTKKVNLRTVYVYTDPVSGEVSEYAANDVIDMVRLPDQTCEHPSPVTLNRHTIGLAIAAEKYAARAFKNGFLPTQLRCDLKTEEMSPAALEDAYLAAVEAVRRSAQDGGWFLGMPPGFWMETVGVNPSDLQLLELKNALLGDIARIFNLPPVFLQNLEHGTFSNTEQQAAMLIQHTLAPIIQQFEQQVNSKLVGKFQKVEVNIDGFLRADYTTRMNGHRTSIQGGFMTPNEVRELEGRPALEGGDVLLIQGATIPLSMAGKITPEPKPAPADEAKDQDNQDDPAKPVEEANDA